MSNRGELFNVHHNGEFVTQLMSSGDDETDMVLVHEELLRRGLISGERDKALEMYRHANAFQRASDLLKDDLSAPYVVNACFSIEVYLKAFSEINGVKLISKIKNRGERHNLAILYLALDDDHRAALDEVGRRFSTWMLPEGVNGLLPPLEALQNLFVQWRYGWEQPKQLFATTGNIDYLLRSISAACREALDRRTLPAP